MTAAVGVAVEGAQHHSDDLIRIFNRCFSRQWNTRLLGGVKEPLYSPCRSDSDSHIIFFTRDYFSSALHEVAHWCIAGPQRRSMKDYGYWYAPDGRNASQQRDFEQVECKPQALEWIFAKSCRRKFCVSLDNLDAPPVETSTFKRAVIAKAEIYKRDGLPHRARRFYDALASFYQGPVNVGALSFPIDEL